MKKTEGFIRELNLRNGDTFFYTGTIEPLEKEHPYNYKDPFTLFIKRKNGNIKEFHLREFTPNQIRHILEELKGNENAK